MTLLLIVLVCAALLVSAAIVWPLRHASALALAKRRALALSIVSFLLIGSAGLYYFLGAARWVDDLKQQQEEQAALRRTIAELTDRSAQHPDNAEHWARLGEAWVQAQDFTQASAAWRQAVLTSGGHPDFIAQYAATLVMQKDGIVTEDALESIAMALKLNPEQPLARKLETLWHEQQRRGEGLGVRD